MTKSRKPNRFEMSFLMMWHGLLTGSLLLTYISGDDIYFLHQFAGYTICIAILVRLLAAAVAPKNSPLYLSLPKLFEARQGRRNPLFSLMAVALIVTTAAAAFSGLMAESIGFKDVHEGLAEGVLPIVIFAHIALVAWKPLMRKISNVSAEDMDKAMKQASAVACVVGTQTAAAVRRAKPYIKTNR